MAKFHDPANEPACEAPLKIMVDDNEKRSVSEYRDLLYAEILKRKRDVRQKGTKVEDWHVILSSESTL